MVIPHLDVSAYPQIVSDNRRRSKSADLPGDEQSRATIDAHSITADVSYSHLYDRTKHFVRTSCSRLKELGRYLGSGDCPQCRQYEALFIEQQHRPERQRFSDSFVEKVQSQQPPEPNMPCFGKDPPEYYCTCVNPNSTTPYPPYKCVPYYSPDREYRRNSFRSWLCCGPRRRKRHWQFCPCGYQHRGEQFQRMRPYRTRRADLNEMIPERLQYAAYNKEPPQASSKQYWRSPHPPPPPPADDNNERMFMRPRTRHSSVEYMKMQYAESEDDLNADGAMDCCCCCPCWRDYQTADVQTEDVTQRKQPKNMDTQTEHRNAMQRKKRCCKCCREGCGNCSRENWRYRTDAKIPQAPNQSHSAPQTPRKCHTLICKSVAMQHSPEVMDGPSCSCEEQYARQLAFMRNPNIFYSQVKPNQMFLDKIYQNHMLAKTLGSFSGVASFTPDFIPPSSVILNSSSTQILRKKSKKKFLNTVCDTIIGDLSAKRKFSFADNVKSPDSGFQDVKRRKSLFSFKKKTDNPSLGSIINLLKDDRLPPSGSDVIGEASVMVRNILEDIHSKERREDVLHSETLRNILFRCSGDIAGESDSAVGAEENLDSILNSEQFLPFKQESNNNKESE